MNKNLIVVVLIFTLVVIITMGCDKKPDVARNQCRKSPIKSVRARKKSRC